MPNEAPQAAPRTAVLHPTAYYGRVGPVGVHGRGNGQLPKRPMSPGHASTGRGNDSIIMHATAPPEKYAPRCPRQVVQAKPIPSPAAELSLTLCTKGETGPISQGVEVVGPQQPTKCAWKRAEQRISGMSVNRGLTLAAARLQILMSIAFSASAHSRRNSYPSISFGLQRLVGPILRHQACVVL